MLQAIKRRVNGWTAAGQRRKDLTGAGERVDIPYERRPDFEDLDLYQKSHYRRYEFSKNAVSPGSVCGDFACGTGYGSVMLAENCRKVVGIDINQAVIDEIRRRYARVENVEFICGNLLDLQFLGSFDAIVSFETLEHLKEEDLIRVLGIYDRALKTGGRLVFSTPYLQDRTEAAMKLGFHFTFGIDEHRIEDWLRGTHLQVQSHHYQNYQTHSVQEDPRDKDFIVCVAKKV